MSILSEYNYHCPSCSQLLNAEKTVIFHVKKKTGESGVIELNPKVGEYSYKCKPEMTFEDKEAIDFFCPACKKSLQSKKFPNFVELRLHVTDTIHFDVLFSRISGDRRTYVITEDMIEKYGDNPEDLI